MKALAKLVLLVVLVYGGWRVLNQPIHASADGNGWEITNTGWATTHVALGPDDDCPNGIQMGSSDTQTDVKRRYPDGNIEQAIVTWNAGSIGNYLPSCGSASGAVFGTPTNPANTAVVITQRENPALLTISHFSLAQAGTHDNQVTRYYWIACDDGAGTPSVSFPTGRPRSTLSNTTLDATNKITITWSGVPVTNCADVRVYRATSDNVASAGQICDTPRATGSCDDTGAAAGSAPATSTTDDPGIVSTFTLPSFAVGSGYLVNGLEAVGQTTISADTGSGGIAKGDTVSFAGSSQQYLVTVALSAGTFQIYPALITQAADNAAITIHDWLKGQHVWERRFRVEADNAGIVKTLMDVWFDVRHYSDGDCQVDIAVNNILDRSDIAQLAYDVDIDISGGADEYNADAYYHVWATRWRKKFDCSGSDYGLWVEDFTDYKAAKLIPTFYSDISNTSYSSTGCPASCSAAWQPGGFGDMLKNMGDPGFRPELGFLSSAAAEYTIHKSASQRERVLANSYVSAHWRAHLTKADGGSITRQDVANYWADFAQNGTCRGVTPNGPAYCVTDSTVMYPISLYVEQNQWENAHLPTLNYLPYFLTGDRWHVDQMRFWGHMTTLSSAVDGVPSGTLLSGANQARGLAWGMRSIWYATAALPDDDYDTPEFEYRLDLNMDALEARSESSAIGYPFQDVYQVCLFQVVEAPASAPGVSAVGGGSLVDGRTYEVTYTYLDDTIGVESGESGTIQQAVSGANLTVRVSVTASTSTYVDSINIYVRDVTGSEATRKKYANYANTTTTRDITANTWTGTHPQAANGQQMTCHVQPWQWHYIGNVLEMIDAWDVIRANGWARTKLDMLLQQVVRTCGSEASDFPNLFCTQQVVENSRLRLPSTYDYLDTFPDDFWGKVGSPTHPSTPSDSGTNMNVHASVSRYVEFDESITMFVNQAIQVTGGAGCTTGNYRIQTDVGSGFWELDRSPAAAGTNGCDWEKRSIQPTIGGWVALGSHENVANQQLPLALALLDLAKREGVSGASAALDAIGALNFTTVGGDTILATVKTGSGLLYQGYGINYADPSSTPSGRPVFRPRVR